MNAEGPLAKRQEPEEAARCPRPRFWADQTVPNTSVFFWGAAVGIVSWTIACMLTPSGTNGTAEFEEALIVRLSFAAPLLAVVCLAFLQRSAGALAGGFLVAIMCGVLGSLAAWQLVFPWDFISVYFAVPMVFGGSVALVLGREPDGSKVEMCRRPIGLGFVAGIPMVVVFAVGLIAVDLLCVGFSCGVCLERMPEAKAAHDAKRIAAFSRWGWAAFGPAAGVFFLTIRGPLGLGRRDVR